MSEEQKNNRHDTAKPSNDMQINGDNLSMKTSEEETRGKENPSKTKPPKLTWI